MCLLFGLFCVIIFQISKYLLVLWCVKTFYITQKLSRKLPSCQENVCLAVQDSGMYAVGCRSYTLLLDARTLQAVKKISPRYSGCGKKQVE